MARGSHKVNPIGFRLGVNKNWQARWYASKKDYADKFLADVKIRKILSEKFKAAMVSSIIIKRGINKMLVEVFVARPGVAIGKSGAIKVDIQKQLSRMFKIDVEIKIFEVKNPEIVARIIAENIAMQCARRIAPKMAAEKAVQAAEETRLIKGITVWIGGRIKGAEMASVVKVSKGVVPRHTLRADIDYAFIEAEVPSAGKHGIKVWVNHGEKNNYQID
jgi:small subunit ribosomal protein S3